jgi:hypothetical protein
VDPSSPGGVVTPELEPELDPEPELEPVPVASDVVLASSPPRPGLVAVLPPQSARERKEGTASKSGATARRKESDMRETSAPP